MDEWYLWILLILVPLVLISLFYVMRQRAAEKMKPPEEAPMEVRGERVEIAAPAEMKAVIPIELTEIKGIGAKRAEKLKALGINTVQDLAKFSPEELSEKTAISTKLLSKWIEQARERVKQTSQ